MGVLVERSNELTLLSGAVTAARSGQGGFVVVEGPAGIGKTSLLAEVGVLVRKAGGRVITARGTELERQFSFGLVRQLFEPLLAAVEAEQRARWLSGGAAPAAAVLGYGGADSPGDFAVLHGLFWLAANLCQDGLLMLSVDDLHWADRGSLRFLSYLQPRLDGLPVLVVVGTRPHEPGAEQLLLDQLQLDRSCMVIRPAPLSMAGTDKVIRELSGVSADEAFLTACHDTTGGNPLLVHELLAAMAAEGLPAVAHNAGRVHELGRRALSSRLRLRLAHLPAECARLVRAVALLGDGAPLPQAAELAGVDIAAAAVAAHRLQQIHVLTGTPTNGTGGAHDRLLSFVHPLVRSAVYDRIGPVDKMTGHATAARLLRRSGADPERIAGHLLRVPPAADVDTVALLRQAARDALGRGSVDTAVTYLQRCLNEPPPDEQRLDVLEELGGCSVMVDAERAVGYLRAAVKLEQRPGRRSRLVEALGHALFLNGRNDEATVVYQRALAELGEDDTDLRSRLQAHLLNVASHDPARQQMVGDLAARLRTEPARETIGSKMRDGLIAFHDAFTAANPDAVQRALRCVADGSVAAAPNGTVPFGVSCWILVAADRDEAMAVFDACLAQAGRHGSFLAVAAATLFRSLSWLWRGSLADAETDARESLAGIDAARFDVARPFATAFLADALMEMGRLAEAEAVLPAGLPADPVYRTPQWYWMLDSRARLLLAQDRTEEALRAALDCGRRFSSHGWANPAFLAWRSTAALAAHRLGRGSAALEYATAELELARRWGAPRALGRALRVMGVVRGAGGIAELREAVAVLESSPARLEHAKALVDLGAALRAANQLPEARASLTEGLELALVCGATPVVLSAEAELRAAGARVRRHELTGIDALTPSEARVAGLAAEGLSNRDIAQRLFVNVKTVEIHLSSTYRKLGISGRAQLADRMAGTGGPEFVDRHPRPAVPARMGA